MLYNWQKKDWPEFRYDLQHIDDTLFAFAEETGHVSGLLKGMPQGLQTEAILSLMVSEAIKTSEIEGEYLSRPDIISSIRNHLGLNINKQLVKDKKAQGVGELMVAVRKTFAEPLTTATLFLWHKMLMSPDVRINVGVWRMHEEAMQVISGAMGKEKIHFEAPPSKQVAKEMDRFIAWFNDTAPGGTKEIKKAALRSAIAHLYFESIHPFEDGNGRIGRAIAEKALSQTMGRPVILSISKKIESDRKSYYTALETAQRSNEITGWVKYFVTTIFEAQIMAKELVEFILKKAHFLDKIKPQINDRQLKAILKMLDAEPEGFKGGMTTKKYVSITGTSKPTATRDLQALAEMEVLINKGGGRNTHYILNLEEKS